MTNQLRPRTLIEALLPRTGTVSAELIYSTAHQAGLADQPVRLALRRLVATGTLTTEGRGASAVISLTPAGRAELDADRLGLNLALAQDAGAQAWDGQWHLTAISTPESDRRRRDAARRSLLSAGAAPASTGLYVSPHDLTELLPDDLNSHIVTAASSTLSLRGMTDPLEITEHLWPAAPVVAPYGALADALDADTTSETPTTRKLRLADALDRALRDDPLIPAELRQTPWRPAQIRRSWRDRWHSIPDSHPTLFDGWFADTLAR